MMIDAKRAQMRSSVQSVAHICQHSGRDHRAKLGGGGVSEGGGGKNPRAEIVYTTSAHAYPQFFLFWKRWSLFYWGFVFGDLGMVR